MQANPWAAVVFILAGMALLGTGFTNPTIIAIYFVLFAVAWVASGYLWDWIKDKRK